MRFFYGSGRVRGIFFAHRAWVGPAGGRRRLGRNCCKLWVEDGQWMAGDAPGSDRDFGDRGGGERYRKGEGVGQHSVEMAERGRRTSFQQGFSGKTDRFGWVFRWVAYILMYPRESGGQNRQKIRRIPLLPCPTLPSSPFGKEPAQEMSCKVRLTTCVRPFVRRRDAVGRENAGERAKCRPFLAVGYLRATGLNGRLSHNKCCGFQRNRDFFHKN